MGRKRHEARRHGIAASESLGRINTPTEQSEASATAPSANRISTPTEQSEARPTGRRADGTRPRRRGKADAASDNPSSRIVPRETITRETSIPDLPPVTSLPAIYSIFDGAIHMTMGRPRRALAALLTARRHINNAIRRCRRQVARETVARRDRKHGDAP